MLKKIWKDPVGSTIIAAIILSVGTFLITAIYGLSTDKPVKDLIFDLWNLKIPLGYTLIGIIFLVILLKVIIKISQTKPSKTERLTNDFRNKFTKFVDEESKITYRFNAHINQYTNYPYITDLRAYCTNHPLEAIIKEYGGCGMPGCQNYRKKFNESQTTQWIESYLLKSWEDMKSYNQ